MRDYGTCRRIGIVASSGRRQLEPYEYVERRKWTVWPPCSALFFRQEYIGPIMAAAAPMARVAVRASLLIEGSCEPDSPLKSHFPNRFPGCTNVWIRVSGGNVPQSICFVQSDSVYFCTWRGWKLPCSLPSLPRPTGQCCQTSRFCKFLSR